jgi:hypothetical protein
MIAGIAAGMFAVLDQASPTTINGDTIGPRSGETTAAPSQWKRQGRAEGLR